MNNIQRCILNYSDCQDPSLLTSFVHEITNNITSENELINVRNMLANSDLIPMNIRLCCFTPISLIPKLRFLGLSRAMNYLVSDLNAYDIIKPKKFKYTDMFYGDDIKSMGRAILPYIMSIISENMPMADKFEDLKVMIWNGLLKIATWIKETTEILPSVVTLDDIISILLDVCYCDGIGDDDNGEKMFYDKFVGAYSIIGFARTNLPSTGSIYIRLITELGDLGMSIIKRMDSVWIAFPHRLIIYMNLKHMIFRHISYKYQNLQ